MVSANSKDRIIERPGAFQFYCETRPWQVGSTIIRREAMDKAGLFDMSLPVSHDLDLMARVLCKVDLG